MQQDLFGNAKPASEEKGGELSTREFNVVAPLLLTNSKAGTAYGQLAVREIGNGDKPFKLLIFGAVIAQARELKVGKKAMLTVRTADTDDTLFLVSAFSPDIKPRSTLLSKSIKEFESKEKYIEYIKEEITERTKAGYVPILLPLKGCSEARVLAWYEKDECVFVAGGWKLKIDFLMDKYGAERVSKALRKLTEHCSTTLTPVKGFTKVSVPWATRYRKWRDARVEEALRNKGAT